MAMFNLLKIRTSTDILKNEKCKVTFGLEYIIACNVKTTVGLNKIVFISGTFNKTTTLFWSENFKTFVSRFRLYLHLLYRK